MAVVTCPKCKKMVSDTSGKCPNCGNTLKVHPLSKEASLASKLHFASNAILGVSFLLLLLEYMNNTKTYVGGILFGGGFLLQGLSLLQREKEKDYDGKKRGKILIAVSVVLILIGGWFLYMDLK
jgi:hypothetical protein